MQGIENVVILLGAPASRANHHSEHGLFVVMQYRRQDADQLPVPAGLFEQRRLKAFKPRRQIHKRGAVTQGTWLALQRRQIVPPS